MDSEDFVEELEKMVTVAYDPSFEKKVRKIKDRLLKSKVKSNYSGTQNTIIRLRYIGTA